MLREIVFFLPTCLQISLENLERICFEHVQFSFNTVFLNLCVPRDLCYIIIINDDITECFF